MMMSLRRKISIAAMLATAVRPECSAAQTVDTNQLQAFTRTEFYKGLLNRALATIPETIFKRCPTLVSNGSRVIVGKPVSFAASGYPNTGAWKQTFLVSGCGNDSVLNIYFLARADEKIDTTIGLSGTTIADLTLQRDAITYAGIGARLGDCKFVVKNTKFEGFGLANPPTPDPGSGERFRPWWETWTLVGCNRTVDVPIDFVPNEKGTQIIQPGGAIER
jgi:hypothetical protein